MGYVRFWLASAALLGQATSCVTSQDPATPCGRSIIGDAEPATFVAGEHAPVLAVAPDETPFVVAWACPSDTGADCDLVRHALPQLASGSNILITSTGAHVVGTDAGGNLLAFQVGTGAAAVGEPRIIDAGPPPIEVIAALRGREEVLVRDRDGRLRYVHPSEPPASPDANLIAPALPRLKVVAVGESHLVGRVALGHGREELYAVSLEDGVVRPLGRGPSFGRVLLGPNDEHAIATSTSEPPETFVFDTRSGALLDRFVGHLASGRRPLEDLPGLRAISPDGSHLAYVTARGAVAMRDLARGDSCLVRSATAGRHTIAGFSAHGTVVFESEENGGTLVAWDPETHEQYELTARGGNMHLAAVPAEADIGRPWAVAVQGGRYYAVDGVAKPRALEMNDVLFVPQTGASMWAVDAGRDRGDTWRHLHLHRVEPFEGEFRVTTPLVSGKSFEVRVNGRVCMSTGTPGSWGERCGNTHEDSFMVSASVPDSESAP